VIPVLELWPVNDNAVFRAANAGHFVALLVFQRIHWVTFKHRTNIALPPK